MNNTENTQTDSIENETITMNSSLVDSMIHSYTPNPNGAEVMQIIEKLEDKIDTNAHNVDCDIFDLRDHLNQIVIAKIGMENNVTEVSTKLNMEIANLRGDNLELREDIEDMRQDILDIHGNIRDVRSETVKLRQDFGDMRNDNIELRQDIEDAFSENIDQCKTKIAFLQKDITKIEEENHQQKLDREHFFQQTQSFVDDQFHSLSKEILLISNMQTKIGKKHADQIEQMEEMQAEVLSDVHSIKKEIDLIEDKTNVTSIKMGEIMNIIDKVEDELLDMKAEFSVSISSIQQNMNAHEEVVDKMYLKQENDKLKTNNLKNEILEEVSRLIISSNDHLYDIIKQKVLAEMQMLEHQIEERLEKMQTEIIELRNTTTLLSKNMTVLRDEVNAALTIDTEVDSRLSRAFTEISNLHADTNVLSTHIREKSSDISEIQSRLNYSQKDITILKNSLNDVTEIANTCKSNIDDVAEHVDHVNENQLHFSKDVIEKLKSISNRIDYLEDNFVELYKNSEDMGTQISQIDKKVTDSSHRFFML